MRDPLDLLSDNAQPIIIWLGVVIDLIWSISLSNGFDLLAMLAVAIPSLMLAGIVLVALMFPAFIISLFQGLRH
jgi:hypothetical protein